MSDKESTIAFYLNLFVCLFCYLVCACAFPPHLHIMYGQQHTVWHIYNVDAVLIPYRIVAKSLTVLHIAFSTSNGTTRDYDHQMSVYVNVRILFALMFPRGNTTLWQLHTFRALSTTKIWRVSSVVNLPVFGIHPGTFCVDCLHFENKIPKSLNPRTNRHTRKHSVRKWRW